MLSKQDLIIFDRQARRRFVRPFAVALILFIAAPFGVAAICWTPAGPLWAIVIAILLILPYLAVGWFLTLRLVRLRSSVPATFDMGTQVVFLRPFKVDRVAARSIDARTAFNAISIHAHGILSILSITADILLPPPSLKRLLFRPVESAIGPFVSIGDNLERLPSGGARHIYVPNDHWQQVVRELTTTACCVLLQAGDSAGFQWELRHVLHELDPRRVFILLGLGTYEQASWPSIVETLTDAGFHIPAAFPGRGCVICFEDNWRPLLAAREVDTVEKMVHGIAARLRGLDGSAGTEIAARPARDT